MVNVDRSLGARLGLQPGDVYPRSQQDKDEDASDDWNRVMVTKIYQNTICCIGLI